MNHKRRRQTLGQRLSSVKATSPVGAPVGATHRRGTHRRGPHRWGHNPANLFRLPHGPGSVHEAISAYYSSKIPGLTGNKTFREWLSTKSFMEQYEYGIEIIKKFGGAKYLPSGLQ